jgi:hypothetical protein
MDSNPIDSFEDLTIRALKQTDVDNFIDCLLKREASVDYLTGSHVRLDEGEAKQYILRENEVLERLEAERKKLFKEMDSLSKNRKIVKKYSPKFPFPPMPVFFDRKG